VNDEEAIGKCVEGLANAIPEVTGASAAKLRHCVDQRPPLPAGIEDEIRLKNRLRRQQQVTVAPA
jgi:hypothetical protein